MTLKCDWFVLCQQVIWDKGTDALTLVNCLEQVTSSSFPSLHHGFAFAARFTWAGEPLKEPLDTHFKLVRWSEMDDKQTTVIELDGRLEPETTLARVFTNFSFMKLNRPERVWFGLESRVAGGRWRKGPAVSVDVKEMDKGLAVRVQRGMERLRKSMEEELATTLPPDSD